MNTICSNRLTRSLEVGKSGCLGVYAIDHVALTVPTLAPAAAFFSAIGLRGTREGDIVSVTGSAGTHSWMSLQLGARKRLARLGFSAYPEDIEAIRERAAQLGHPAHASGNTLLFDGPDGVEIRVVGRDRGTAPAADRGPLIFPSAPPRSQIEPPETLGLSHVAIFTTDVDAALSFYTGVLGLALSDRSGSALAFLHAPHGSDHHVLALAQSSGPGLHHYSWEMGSIDAVGMRAAFAAEQGFAAGWGMGRHVLGSNFFHYIRDPWGSHAELTAGLDYIPPGSGWVAGDHPREDAFYLWGPPPPPDFMQNSEVSEPLARSTIA